MSLNPEDKRNLLGINSVIASELHRLEENRLDWLKHIKPTYSYEMAISAIEASSRSATMATFAAQSANQKITDQFKADQERLKRYLDTISSIHKHFAADKQLQKLIDQATKSLVLSEQFTGILKQSRLDSTIQDALEIIRSASINQAKSLLATHSVESHISKFAKSFNDANKQWMIPRELTESISSLKVMEDAIGKLTLPVLDWPSAATLAQILGKEGIASQLAALGIGPDGVQLEEAYFELDITEEQITRAIASINPPDFWTLISLVMAILMFSYQEWSSSIRQDKTDFELAEYRQSFELQQKQLNTLSNLLIRAAEREAERSVDRFVVLERVATIRSKPESGSGLVSKLLPREVVQLISEKGKWIEVRYYDWPLQDYQTGWTLKKYYKRVPANHDHHR